MPVGQVAEISTVIDQKLEHIGTSYSECCIFRVHNVLRSINPKAYEPEIVSIGPYHRNKDHLQMMEEHKLRFLQLLLQRKKDNVSRYVAAMKDLEEKARRCYAESTGLLSSDDFVGMMVIDGCFVIELISKFFMLKSSQEKNDPLEKVNADPLFRMEWTLTLLQRDLMLFENQLPFFVLTKLYEMIEPSGHKNELILMALQFFNDLFPGNGKQRRIGVPGDNSIKHLLDLIHRNWSTTKLAPNPDCSWNMENIAYIESSTELAESGIKFKKLDNEDLFDIVFENGVLQIPVLTIEDRTECFLRNLVAYEQHCGNNHFNIVTDYMTFFGFLIKSVEDVKKLSHHGIIRSFVGGDNEAVCKMFSTMTSSVVGPSRNFHYALLFKEVHSHCGRGINRWIACLPLK